MAKKSKPANDRQRKYVQGRVAGKTKKQAAIDAGYSEAMGENAKQKLDRSPAVQQLFSELMEAAGVTNQLLAQRIFEGLHATESKFWQPRTGRILVTEEGPDGVPVLAADQLISRNLIAFSERREMLELALKVKGLLVDKHELEAGASLGEILARSYEQHGQK